MNKINEVDIPRLIRSGNDKEVIEHLYKKVLPQVKKFVVKNSGNNEDANDIFHDALMLFYEQVVKSVFNEKKYKVYGYLYKISIYRWINKCKRDKNLVIQEELPELEYDLQSPSFYSQHEDVQYLKVLFSKIGEKCIELLNYTIYTDLQMEDIMHRMGFTSVDAVRMQQMRCKQKLLKEIERNPSLIDKLRNI